MKPSDVVRCLKRLHSLYPERDVPPETMARYAEMLCDLEPSKLVAAIERHAATNKFWPTVAELRALALEDTTAPSAEMAWGEVMRAVRRYGRYRTPSLSHAAVEAAVEAVGGWNAICSDESDGVLRAHFYRTYNSYVDQAQRDANFAGLPSSRRSHEITAGDAVKNLLEAVTPPGESKP